MGILLLILKIIGILLALIFLLLFAVTTIAGGDYRAGSIPLVLAFD